MGITEEVLCQGLPNAFVEYMKYVKKLEFEQTPDYRYLRNLFIEYLSKIVSRNEMYKNIQFFWIRPAKKVKKEKETSYNNLHTMLRKVTSFSKKSNSLIKIYHRIKSSFNKNAVNKYNYSANSNFGEKMGISFPSNESLKHSKNLSENLIQNINNKFKPERINNNNLDLKSEIREHNYFSVLNNKNLFINLNDKKDDERNSIFKRKLLNTINNNNSKKQFIRKKVKYGINESLMNYSANTNSKALYNNINYNNLYFINNTTNNTSYQPLNRNKFLNKNILLAKGNVKRIDNIISLNRNIIYRPIFKAKASNINNYPSK